MAGWADLANIALAIIALLALIGAAIQTHVTRSTSRETLTYNYTERFSNPELLPYHQKTVDLFKLDGTATDTERYAAFQEWRYEEQLAALLLPNLFEELAGMYNQGLLHKGIARDFFGKSAAALWEMGSWFIYLSRETDESYYEQWELMLRDMGLAPRGPT